MSPPFLGGDTLAGLAPVGVSAPGRLLPAGLEICQEVQEGVCFPGSVAFGLRERPEHAGVNELVDGQGGRRLAPPGGGHGDGDGDDGWAGSTSMTAHAAASDRRRNRSRTWCRHRSWTWATRSR
jgi:hypothetical protein